MADLTTFTDEALLDIASSDVGAELRKRGFEHGWYKKASFVGAIYVLVNPAFPDLVKIGYADDVRKRLKVLNGNSGLPDPFHCYALYRVKKRLEDLKLHSLIDTLDPSLRHAKNREFYEMNCGKAYEILSAIAQINGDEEQLVLNPFSDSYFDSDKAEPETPPRTQKQSRLKFDMIGIPVGSTLVFTKDPSISCVTVDDVNKVRYNGEIYVISALAAKLLHHTSAQGGQHFMFNGEPLTEIRKRLGV